MNTQPDPSPPLPDWLAPVLVLIVGAVAIIGFAVWVIGKHHGGEEHEAETPQAHSSLGIAEKFAATATDDVAKNPELLKFALERGEEIYNVNCANCHGADLKGLPAQHTPDMTDAFWLFGGDDIDTFQMHPSDIEKTIKVGIHDFSHKDTRNLSDMPPFGVAGRAGLSPKEIAELQEEGRPILSSAEISDLTQLVLYVSKQGGDGASAERGHALYMGNAGCFDCHAPDFKGDPAIGSADLTAPGTWLYGSDAEHITESIVMGRLGVSPAFDGKLSPDDIKATAIYVMSHHQS